MSQYFCVVCDAGGATQSRSDDSENFTVRLRTVATNYYCFSGQQGTQHAKVPSYLSVSPMGRTRTSTKPITEELLKVKQPNQRKTKSKPRVNDSSDSDGASDMELSPKSKKRSIAEVIGSDDEEQQIRPKAKKSRVAAKPKASKTKNKNISNTNVIFEETLASDDDFEVRRTKRVTRESTDDGDEVLFTAHEEGTKNNKKQSKKTSVKQEKMRVSEDEPMSDLQHFAASDDEQEWEDVQWDDAMPAVSEIKREIKSEM